MTVALIKGKVGCSNSIREVGGGGVVDGTVRGSLDQKSVGGEVVVVVVVVEAGSGVVIKLMATLFGYPFSLPVGTWVWSWGPSSLAVVRASLLQRHGR